MFLNVVLVVLLLAFLTSIYFIYKALMSPELAYHSWQYKLKAKLFFWIGDIRKIDAPPYFTWAKEHHLIDFKDARKASFFSRAGDIGLHRDKGVLSNCGIPGAFKHAWICLDGNDCIEAVSEGVLRRDELYPLKSDYAIILRPLGTNKADADQAIARANGIVGCQYDANFNFDLERSPESAECIKNLNAGNFHKAFSCTEVAAYSWYHCKQKLGIFRTKYAGREAIAADDFLKMNFGIIWMSPSVTLEWAEEHDLHEEGRHKIKDFLDGKRDFNDHGNPLPKRR
jgi:hypothetical protein